MAKAVIGIFDSSAEAREAVRNLESRGISSDHVDIRERAEETGTEEKHEGIGESISNFFSNLFGNDDDAKNYSEVANRGCTVTVYTDSNEEAENVADILDDCGAIDVDERITRYRSGMGTSAGMGTNAGMGAGSMGTGNISGSTRERMPGEPNTGVPGGTGQTPISRQTSRPGMEGDTSYTGETGTTPTGSNQSEWSGRTAQDPLEGSSYDTGRTGNTGMGQTPISGENSRTDMSGNLSSSEETGWTSPSGEMRTGSSQSNQSEWSGRTGEDPLSSASDRHHTGEPTSGSAKIHRSRIFDTPDDLRSRIGRRHPSPSNRGTTGDINPLNQQDPDWGL
ncbi:MAG TPA: hypothetical protein VGD92_06285 [Sphingobacteriaceae bacterium]